MEKNTLAIAVQPKVAALEIAKPVINFTQAHQLAETYGTPLLVYSREAIRENYWVLKNAMPTVDLFYAVKANYEDCILETVYQEGGFVDICSTGELKKTLDVGFTVDQMIHTHPCKTMENLQICHEAGVRWFTFDCPSEATKMLSYTKDYNLILRLKASGENSLINLSAKFGCALEEVEALIDHTLALGGIIKGLAFHVGSQCSDTKDYLTMLRNTREIWDMCIQKGCPLEILDIGGGFPAPYREPMISLQTFAEQVYSHIQATFGDTNARFVAEPGRGIAARNATLITKILGKNYRSGDTWYFIDEGLYGCFSGIMFDHVKYELLYENEDNTELSTCIIAGPTCDSSDIVSNKEHLLPDLKIGDLLLAATMGAYTHSTAAAFFNGLPPAKVIVLD